MEDHNGRKIDCGQRRFLFSPIKLMMLLQAHDWDFPLGALRVQIVYPWDLLGFDPSETLTSRGCAIGHATLRFGDGQKRGLACRLVWLGCFLMGWFHRLSSLMSKTTIDQIGREHIIYNNQ